MNGAVAMLDSYSTSMIYLISSAFVVSNCSVDMEDENKVLKQLKTLYVTNLVKIFAYLNLNLFYDLHIILFLEQFQWLPEVHTKVGIGIQENSRCSHTLDQWSVSIR